MASCAVGAKARILVVDDDAKTVASVRLYLEHAGYQVDTAADGRAGLERARAEPTPDLVVLDRMLPHLDGLAVCRLVRGESGIPVILLTARTSEADRLEGLDLGADDYVSKPFSPRELVARVRAVLRRTRPEDVLRRSRWGRSPSTPAGGKSPSDGIGSS